MFEKNLNIAILLDFYGDILTEMEQKLNLASRFVTVQEKTSEIASRLSKINSEINDSFVSNEINLVIKQIKELADYTD